MTEIVAGWRRGRVREGTESGVRRDGVRVRGRVGEGAGGGDVDLLAAGDFDSLCDFEFVRDGVWVEGMKDSVVGREDDRCREMEGRVWRLVKGGRYDVRDSRLHWRR